MPERPFAIHFIDRESIECDAAGIPRATRPTERKDGPRVRDQDELRRRGERHHQSRLGLDLR